MFQSFLLNTLLATSALGAAVPAPPKKHNFNGEQGAPWQIILSGTLTSANNIEPSSANVWDLDLFNTDASVISSLKQQGKTVICYFSAGTSEPDRPDLGALGEGDKGAELKDWPGENWLNLKSENVLNIMNARIQQAAEKGCDAVDPDNMDGYQENGGGLGLTTEDSIAFFQQMASTASSAGLAIGLKNAADILPTVADQAQFAVNEQCSELSECESYSSFLGSGKPVYHIEYNVGADVACSNSQFSTVIKNLSLDGYVQYCDGSTYTTPTDGSNNRGKKGGE